MLPLSVKRSDNEIKLKILCTCSDDQDCSRLHVMNDAFLSVKDADKYLRSMASEGLIQYNDATKRCKITSHGTETLMKSSSNQSK